AHGIEPAARRAAAGKLEVGSIEVVVKRRGGRLAFVCRDDGAGIDVDAVRRAAVDRGLMAAADAAALAADDAMRLILRAGLTTARTADEVSGRGVGLDVVRETVAKLKGDVRVTSERGVGTTFDIVVPVSLSSVRALEVD